jgi:hypothetical protein
MDAVEKAFKPNTTVDVLKFREELSNLGDKNMSYHEWDYKFGVIVEKLAKLKALPSVSELDQIVIKNISNTHLEGPRQKLMEDTVKLYASDADRRFTYVHFREVALSLASQDQRIDNYCVSGKETVLYAGDSNKKVYKKECWRCGGDHMVHGCVNKTCTKCNANLVDASGKLLRHEARTCSSGGGPPPNVNSKGGEKGDKGGKKGKGSGGGAKKSSGAASDSLPDPSLYKSKQLKAFMSKASVIVKERDHAVGSKRKKEADDWAADDEG